MFKKLGTSKVAFISLLLVGAILSTVLVLTRVINVLPKILGDELTYSMDARHYEPAQALVPNYLFNMLFSTTSMCGYGFYTCSKFINLVMLFGIAVVVFFAAKLVTDTKAAIWIAFLAFLGPISSYVSYFTPDVMFFLSASIVILALMNLNQESPWWRWALIGVGVGISTLVKPHGLFLIGPVVLYVIYLAAKRGPSRSVWALISGFSFGAALFATKLSLGFLFAGPKGLALFGGNYDNSAGKVLSTSSGATVGDGSAAAIPTPQGLGSGEWSFSNPTWIFATAFSVLLHISFVLVFYAVPIAAIFAGRSKPSKRPGALQPELSETYKRVRFLIVATLATLMAVSSVYVVISQAWGEILTNRVMVRYYEFAVIFIPLLVAPFLTRATKYTLGWKWGIGVPVFLIALFAAPVFQNNAQPLYADSSLIASVIQSGVGIVAVALFGFAILIVWFTKSKQGAKLWIFVFAPLVVVLFNVSSYYNMTIPSSYVGKYTQSSQWVHNNLTDSQKKGLIVFGGVRSNVQAALLWIDDPSVIPQPVDPNGKVDLQGVKPGTYVLVVGGIPVVGQTTTIRHNPSWEVLRVEGPAK